jgi:hypothetical protein
MIMNDVVRWQQLIDALGPPTSTREINDKLPDGSWGLVTWQVWSCDCLALQVAASYWEHAACDNPDHVAISKGPKPSPD